MKMGKIIHLGIVVEDLDKAVKLYEEHLGIGPWVISSAADFFRSLDVTGGRGLEIRTAIYYGDGYEIELIEPIGEGLYMDWLREKGPGVHHVKFDTQNSYREVVDECRALSRAAGIHGSKMAGRTAFGGLCRSASGGRPADRNCGRRRGKGMIPDETARGRRNG